MAGNDSLTARQSRFVAALLTAPTIEAAAQAAGVSERTAYRYLELPTVKASLAAALDDAMLQAARRAAASMTAAVDVLSRICQNSGNAAGVRVSAARAILEAGPRLREALDLAERVAALEAQNRG